jgi:hypothetical protein
LNPPQQIEEKRPWDLRLIESMSRDSDRARPNKTSQLVAAAVHVLLFGVPAVVSGRPYLVLFVALYPLALLGRYLRDRAKRQKADRIPVASTSNPFGR